MLQSRCRLTLSFLFLLFANHSFATSQQGGFFEYEHISGDSFLITLTVYSECGVPPGIFQSPRQVTFSSSCQNSFTHSLPKLNGNGTYFNNFCSQILTPCSSGPPSFWLHVFQDTVVISTPCSDWTMSWGSCCRPLAVNITDNLGNPVSGLFEYSAMMNTQLAPGNSGPKIQNLGPNFVPLGQPYTYNQLATDPDGNTLKYKLYTPPIASLSPATSYTIPDSLTIDSLTGEIFFLPNDLGRNQVFVAIEEYDQNNNLIGRVVHDFHFIVILANNNIHPEINPGYANVNGALQTAPNSLIMCQGGSLSFDITASDSNSGDTVTFDLSVLQQNLPGASVVTSGQNPVTLSVSWTPPSGFTGLISFGLGASDNFCPATGIASQAFHLQVSAGVEIPEDTLNLCNGMAVQIQATAVDSLVWSVLSGDPITNQNFSCDSCFSPVVNPSQSTTYIVQTTTGGLCQGSDTVHIAVNPSLQFTLDNYTDSICLQDTSLINITSVSTQNYTLTASAIGNVSISGNQITYIPDSVTNDVIYLNLESNTCSFLDSIQIEVSPGLNGSDILISDSTVCYGDSIQLQGVSSIVNSGIAYQWNLPGVSGTVNTNQVSYLPSSSGMILLTLTDSIGGCQEVQQQNLALSPPLSLITSADTLVCSGSQVAVMAQAFGGLGNYSYTWDHNQLFGNGGVLTLASPLLISVFAQDSFGCASDSSVINLNVSGPVQVNGLNDSSICKGSTINFQASASSGIAPYTYSWSTNQLSGAGGNLSPDSSLEVWAIAQDSLGCLSDTTAVNIEVSNPELTNFPGDSLVCSGSILNLQAVSQNGIAPYNYSWSHTAQNGPNVNLTVDSNVQVSVFALDSIGCSTDTLISLFSVGAPLIVSLPDDTSIASNDSVVICPIITGGLGPYSLSWNPPQNDSCIVVYGSGGQQAFSVNVTDGCGSSQPDGILILVHPPIGLPELSNSLDLQVFPNPTSDLLHLRAGVIGSGRIEAKLFDLQGQLVLQKTVNVQDELKLGELEKGSYLLRLEQDSRIGYQIIVKSGR